jgi:hypothetical protein
VVWRVEGIAQKDAEVPPSEFGTAVRRRSAATDATRVFRLPGFNNKKYLHTFQVKLAPGTLPDPIYHQSDFRIEPISSEPGSAIRTYSSVCNRNQFELR